MEQPQKQEQSPNVQLDAAVKKQFGELMMQATILNAVNEGQVATIEALKAESEKLKAENEKLKRKK